MEFPDRVFTIDEVKMARQMIEKGYKHDLEIEGIEDFKNKVNEALDLIKKADYYSFLISYIKKIVDVNGFSQLREAEVAIWVNKYAVADPVDGASFFIQKAYQMKEYIDGKLYYGSKAEKRAVDKRIEFLVSLKKRSENNDVKKKCDEFITRWTEMVYP